MDGIVAGPHVARPDAGHAVRSESAAVRAGEGSRGSATLFRGPPRPGNVPDEVELSRQSRAAGAAVVVRAVAWRCTSRRSGRRSPTARRVRSARRRPRSGWRPARPERAWPAAVRTLPEVVPGLPICAEQNSCALGGPAVGKVEARLKLVGSDVPLQDAPSVVVTIAAAGRPSRRPASPTRSVHRRARADQGWAAPCMAQSLLASLPRPGRRAARNASQLKPREGTSAEDLRRATPIAQAPRAPIWRLGRRGSVTGHGSITPWRAARRRRGRGRRGPTRRGAR